MESLRSQVLVLMGRQRVMPFHFGGADAASESSLQPASVHLLRVVLQATHSVNGFAVFSPLGHDKIYVKICVDN